MADVLERPRLTRNLSLGLLVIYGVGIIIGAGVYVVIGEVIRIAGSLAVWSFAVAGVLASLIALSYAELGARHPEAAGAVAYTKEAFGSDRFSQLTGLAVAAVVLISAATIARGTAGYARTFVELPETLIAVGVVLVFTAVACLGVKDSVRAAAAMTVVEVIGLVMVVIAGWGPIRDVTETALPMAPIDLDAWIRVWAGAFPAFFAFTGFESLANMAEEAKDAARTIPRSILLSLCTSTMLYMIVALAVVSSAPLDQIAASQTPLLSVVARRGWGISNVFAAIALVAVANGVLIQILMLSRLFYGMARRSLLPGGLAEVSRRRVPVRATLIAGALVVFFTVSLRFDALLRLSTTVTLVIFAVVSLSLCRLQWSAPRQDLEFQVPRWIPVAATLGSIALIAAQFAFETN